MKQEDKLKIIIVLLYGDDLIYTWHDEKMFENFKSSMQNKFAMTYIGNMRYFLGVEVKQIDYGTFIH